MMSSRNSSEQIICLRPESDFIEFDAIAPARFQVEYINPSDPAIMRFAERAKALIIPAVGSKIPNEIFENSDIKMVQVTGAGIDRLDADFCYKNQIAVCNVQGGSAFAVAEYCIGSVIMLSRQLHLGINALSRGDYSTIRSKMIKKRMVSLQGQHVGIVGFGSIGRETAKLFKMMGCQISCFDVVTPDLIEAGKINAQICDLPTLLSQSDIVSIHVPLTDITNGLISDIELQKMKKNAILINAARGGIVNERALAAALETGIIKGAVVDVYSQEPALSDNPLFNLSEVAMERIFFSPHIAGITKQSWTYLFQKSWQNLALYFDNEPLSDRQI